MLTPTGLTLNRPRKRAPIGLPEQGTLKAPGPAPTLPESRRARHGCWVGRHAGAPRGISPRTTEPCLSRSRSGPSSAEARPRSRRKVCLMFVSA